LFFGYFVYSTYENNSFRLLFGIFAFLFIAVSAPVAPLFTLAFYVLFGYYFDLFPSMIICLLSTLLGLFFVYAISKIRFQKILAKKFKKRVAQFTKEYEKSPFLFTLFLRLFRIIPNYYVDMFVGISKLKFNSYFFATLLAQFILVAFFVAFGNGIRSLAEGVFRIDLVFSSLGVLFFLAFPSMLRNAKNT
jgi:uncharacterized membrane protein YdjX (TVP38/TMEM64 family)